MTHFFVSYNRYDRAGAKWIAGTLEEEGHTTVIQAWDFRAGGNFVLDMQKATSATDRKYGCNVQSWVAKAAISASSNEVWLNHER